MERVLIKECIGKFYYRNAMERVLIKECYWNVLL